MTTIVSGLILLSRFSQQYRKTAIDTFLKNAEYLLRSSHNKVIFMEKDIIETYFDEEEYPNTTFVPFEKEELWLWKHREEFLKIPIAQTTNPTKDCHDYHMVQLQKTDWVKRAMELNPYDSTNFVWMDIGIYYIMKNQSLPFYNALESLVNKSYSKVRIGSAWDLKKGFYSDDMPMWYFLGGVFGGDRDSLLLFDQLTKKKTMEHIKNNRFTWEVNIWYLVYLIAPGLFETYKADHDLSIIKDY